MAYPKQREPQHELPELSLEGPGLRLRPFNLGDLGLIEEASNDSFIPTITTVPPAFTTAKGRDFIERQRGRRRDGEGWSLAVHDTALDRPVGQIGLWLRNLSKGRAEIGYWVVGSARGRGVAGQATDLLSEWACEHLDVDRLSLFVEPWNLASIRTAEAAGYEREGLLKNWQRVGGVAKDMYAFVRLPPEQA